MSAQAEMQKLRAQLVALLNKNGIDATMEDMRLHDTRPLESTPRYRRMLEESES